MTTHPANALFHALNKISYRQDHNEHVIKYRLVRFVRSLPPGSIDIDALDPSNVDWNREREFHYDFDLGREYLESRNG